MVNEIQDKAFGFAVRYCLTRELEQGVLDMDISNYIEGFSWANEGARFERGYRILIDEFGGKLIERWN